MNAKVQFGIIFWWAKGKKEPNVDTVLKITSIKGTDPPPFCSSIYCPSITLLSKIIPIRISQSFNTKIQKIRSILVVFFCRLNSTKKNSNSKKSVINWPIMFGSISGDPSRIRIRKHKEIRLYLLVRNNTLVYLFYSGLLIIDDAFALSLSCVFRCLCRVLVLPWLLRMFPQ